MNDHFSVSVLVDTTCSHNWIVGDGGWFVFFFFKGDHVTHSRVYAVVLRGNAWGVRLEGACMHSMLRDWLSGVHTCSFLLICTVLSYRVSLPSCTARQSVFFFFLGYLLVSVDQLLQNTAHVTRVQMRSEFPEGNRVSIPSDIPRRHYSSRENDQIASSQGWRWEASELVREKQGSLAHTFLMT